MAGEEIAVTFSAGLSNSEIAQGYSALLSEVDKALYLAKAAGRNRIVHVEDIAAIKNAPETSMRTLAM